MPIARNLTRRQWKNLWSSWRWAKNRMTLLQASAWVAFYNPNDAALLLYLHNNCGKAKA